MSIASELMALNNAKTAIKEALESKGVATDAVPFTDYAAALSEIQTNAWVRPSDWLALPAVGPTDEIAAGLLAVFNNDSQRIALIAAGDYTVDWGDGTTNNYASGVLAEHTYTYSAIDSGTLTAEGYKQVLVTVTPQVGQDLTSVNFGKCHSAFIASTLNVVGWLDLLVGSPNLIDLKIGASSSPSSNTRETTLLFLERVEIVSHALTNFNHLLAWCKRLQVFSADTSSVTSMNGLFFSCNTLTYGPVLDTSSVTTMADMFSSCIALETVPDYNTALVTTFANTFLNCVRLKKGPAFNTGAATILDGMFNNCNSLVELPSYNWASVVAHPAGYITACGKLSKIGGFTVPYTTGFGLFTGNTTLCELPAINLAAIASGGIGPLSNRPQVTRSLFYGLRESHTYANCNLGPAALNEIFTNLGTALSGATITITGNWGASDGATDRSIATAKGWTVTG